MLVQNNSLRLSVDEKWLFKNVGITKWIFSRPNWKSEKWITKNERLIR